MIGRCLLLTGPPGAGKTVVASIIGTKFDRSVVVAVDDFFDLIRSGYLEPWTPEAHEQNTLVMENVASVAASFAKSGYLTIVEGLFIPGWFYEPVRQHLRSQGVAVVTVILRASLEASLERAASRPDRPVGDPATIRQLWYSFADLGTSESAVVDTTAMDADATARIVLDRLASAS